MNYDIYTGMLKMADEFQAATKEINLQYGYDEEIARILNEKYSIKEIAGDECSLSKSINLLEWLTAHTYHKGDYDGHITNNAIDLLNFAYDTGEAGAINCRSLSIILTECCLAVGLKARTMYLFPCSPYDGDNHVVTEVYIPEKEKWVMFDPSYNAYVMDSNLEMLSILEVRKMLSDRKEIMFNDRINYNGEYNLDLKDIEAYYAKDLFWIQCRERQTYNSEQLKNRIITFAPVGYDIKKSKIANIDYRITMWGDGQWMQEWKKDVENDKVIYAGLEELKAWPVV